MLLSDLEVILKIAEHRSITAAATHLDMRAATASAALKRVEKALGAEIFIRTTRQLRLSSAGERYIPECEKALLLLEQARQNIKEDLDVVDGELRITLPSDLGRNVVTPWLDELLDKHPNLSLRVNLSDSQIDFYRDSVDMALRYGSPKDAGFYGFKICDTQGLLCASPEYLEEHGIPQHPHELPAHNALFYQLYDKTHDVWEFTKDKQIHKVKMNGNRASNDGDLVKHWCIEGKGLAVKSCLDLSNDILAGRLIPIMTDYQAKQNELWLICPSRQSITPAVRLLRDTLREKCAELINRLSI
ncbi:LysR family transcriptional regulator [Psychrobacter sp. 2Y5]|uniref:LysR family transcriptional regulator n=1 Tax=unclassified Psychrobacter TaxID=196806 RepID=UPI003F44EFFD